MRYGKGTDLPGLNDPRGEQVGVIFVEPEDSHEEILTAILTQDKLDREQIIIDLPQQNRAFQRPEDFDDLKQMRRQIQGELIFITPPGPGPAELARQRRFSVFSSAESFVTDFLGVPPSTPTQQPDTPARHADKAQVAPQAKKGWGLDFGAFGRGRSAPSAPVKQEAPPPVTPRTNRPRRQPEISTSTSKQSGQPTSTSEHRRSRPLQPPPMNKPEIPNVQPASIEALPTQEQPPISADQTSIWEISPAQLSPISEPPVASPIHLDQEDDDALPPAAPSSPHNLPQTPPITPTSGNAASNGATTQKRPSKPLTTPVPIQLPKPKTTRKLAELQPAGMPTPAVTPMPGGGKQASYTPSGNTGKTVAVKKEGTGTSPMQKKAPVIVTAGGLPSPRDSFAPPSHSSPTQKTPQSRTHKRDRKLAILLVATLSIVILVLLGSLIFASPSDITRLFSSPVLATIAITSDSQTLTDTYTFQGLTTGTPNADARQVITRQLTATKTNQKQVNVTGKRDIPAKQATGTLTFWNGSAKPQTLIPAVTRFPVNGVTVVLDQSVTIPASNLSAGVIGTAQMSAYVVETGTQGNLPANSINGPCCTADESITVSSSAFTGGQAEVHYTYLQQSDVDKAFNETDRSSLQKASQSDLNQQVRSNEHRLPETSSCNPVKTTSSVAVNARITATTATVTISETCQETVFDYQSTLQISQKALKSKAMKQLDRNYALQGDVTITKVTPGTDPIFTVAAQGTWTYNWTEAAKQELLRQLAGKTQAQAQDLLKTYQGVAQATIKLENGAETVPTNPNQISLTVKNR